MPTLKLDIVDSSSAFLTGNVQQEVYRGFVIDEMDTSVDPSALSASAVTVLATNGITMGQSHPNFPSALLSRLEIQGLLPDAVSGRLCYGTMQGATPTSYVLTRSTRLVQEMSNVLPNGQVIGAAYPASDPKQSIPRDYISMTFMRPCTVLTAEGVRYGPPNYPGADYVGYVNATPWGGRPAGHWMISEFITAWSRFEGYHTFRCSLQAFINGRDWSTFGILRSQLTGRYANNPTIDSAILSAVTDPYAYSADIGGHGASDGFVHVGGYPMVNFSSIGL